MISGLKNIAAFVGLSPWQVRRLVSLHRLPVRVVKVPKQRKRNYFADTDRLLAWSSPATESAT